MDETFKKLIERTITGIDLTGCTTIKERAFCNCTQLQSVTIPNTVSTIGSFAFQDCSSLTSIVLPNITTINEYLFRGCTSMSSITIPSTVTTIGMYAFNGCTNLATVTMQPTTPPKLGYSVFPSTIQTIYVPSASLSAYQSASGWSSFANKMVGV